MTIGRNIYILLPFKCYMYARCACIFDGNYYFFHLSVANFPTLITWYIFSSILVFSSEILALSSLSFHPHTPLISISYFFVVFSPVPVHEFTLFLFFPSPFYSFASATIFLLVWNPHRARKISYILIVSHTVREHRGIESARLEVTICDGIKRRKMWKTMNNTPEGFDRRLWKSPTLVAILVWRQLNEFVVQN